MQWTMPHRALQVVASLIALIALTSFVLGAINAPSRGRLPGERPAVGDDVAAPINAPEATPLSQERIEGPPPPAPLTEEEQAKAEADKAAKAQAQAAAKAAANQPVAPVPIPAPASLEHMEAPQAAPQLPEEPPH